ncbi:MAG: radical SAM family heme chaperone HemW [Acidaminococcaceae bacterium]
MLMVNRQEAQGVYIHTPFCLQKCLYCDFASFAGVTAEEMHRYVQRLVAEITERAGEMPLNSAATIFFGGGTPSLLALEDVELIVTTLKTQGFWQRPAEVTMEMNPGTVNLAKLCGYRALGIDRVSLGVQSLNDQELKTIGRIHTAAEALQAISLAQEAGFTRISADLIYGLPGQTLSSFQATLEALTATGINHISAYSLIVEEGTPLASLVATGQLVLPGEEETGAMYDYVIDYLASKGLGRYEISNFAAPGQASQHNLIYWHYQPYYGFGTAACTFTGQQRLTNAATISGYLQKQTTTEELDTRTRLAEQLFLGLRTVDGVNLGEVRANFQVDVLEYFGEQLAKYFTYKMLVYDAATENLRLTRLGMQYGNQIFETFL